MSSLMDYTVLCKVVSSMEKESRYQHSLGVAEVASTLLDRFIGDPVPGLYTGIFHDAYRYLDGPELLSISEKAGIDICPEERANPMLLHGAVAAINFTSVAGDCPESWLRAMRHHTLGAKDMGIIGAALYIADYSEPGRKHITNEERARIYTKRTLEEMVLAVLYRERKYSAEIGRTMAERTIELTDFLEEGGRFEL